MFDSKKIKSLSDEVTRLSQGVKPQKKTIKQKSNNLDFIKDLTTLKQKPKETKATGFVYKEVVSDTAEDIANKLNTLEAALNPRVIDGLPTLEQFIKELKDPQSKNKLEAKDILNLNQNPAKGRLDQRWHGAGLSSISSTTPTSITGILKGDGTTISAATAGTDYTTSSSTETFTNKSLKANSVLFIDQTDATKKIQFNLAPNTTGTTRLITFPDANQTIVGLTTSQSLSNKTFNLTSNTLTGTLAEFNTACSDADFTSLTGTETLTNKRITKRVVAVTQSATPTINTDNTDVAYITGLAQAVTSFTSNLSGTPVNGDTLIIDITDNGTGRALTFGASFEASGNVALPTTTIASTKLTIGFRWNTITSKWTCVAVA